MGADAISALVAPLQAALLEDPLAFLAAEHGRQTVLLGHLERVARAPLARTARGLAPMLLGWLATELPLHAEDEELSLYPRLQAADGDGVLASLRLQHAACLPVVREVLAGLRRLAAGEPPADGFAGAALGFARSHRQHLALEEARVAPLARRVLDAPALAALAAEMMARRATAKPG